MSLISLQTIHLMEAATTNTTLTGPYKKVQEILDKTNKNIDLNSIEFQLYVKELEGGHPTGTKSPLIASIAEATFNYYQELKKADSDKIKEMTKQAELKYFIPTIKDLIQKHNNQIK